MINSFDSVIDESMIYNQWFMYENIIEYMMVMLCSVYVMNVLRLKIEAGWYTLYNLNSIINIVFHDSFIIKGMVVILSRNTFCSAGWTFYFHADSIYLVKWFAYIYINLYLL